MLLEMASAEGEALSEASPSTGEPRLGRHSFSQNCRRREMCRASGMCIRGPHPQDHVSCSDFSQTTHQWGLESWEIPGVSTVSSGRRKPSVCAQGGAG